MKRSKAAAADPEQDRLDASDAARASWRAWGPYVAERAWGGVREDYSATGDAWASFPFEHAVSRAYRWNEDGLMAWSDEDQHVCLGLSLWNGLDPILKERPFGLNGAEGNHGEDAKDYWWYVDNTPTHSWARTRYAYPTGRFPYEDLRTTNQGRNRNEPEYELLDTGIFAENRYVMVAADWAKSSPEDVCVRFTFENRGPDAVTMHVLPTVWFRNTWSWGDATNRPTLRADGDLIRGKHPEVGDFVVASAGSTAAPELLFCENETNVAKLYGAATFAGAPATAYPKDGINDHVLRGSPTVNPDRLGTKAAFHHVLTIDPGASATVRVRLVVGTSSQPVDLAAQFEQVLSARATEADAYWQRRLTGLDPQRAHVVRQAFAGLLASKQYYPYDVRRWLSGDPGQPPPPPGHASIRNADWAHLRTDGLFLMPDAWEYPWFAAWDLAFHCVVMALIDPVLAKTQLLKLLQETHQHPNGQLPAYEWNLSDVNPPLHAWAALQIYLIDGSRDRVFLEKVMHKLLINFTWWVNRKDTEGNNLFGGGFLGLDNIGPLDRSKPLPGGGVIEQSDGTAWMAMYCLDLLNICVALSDDDHTYEDLSRKFLQHFCLIAEAANDLGLWNEVDGFYYDVIRSPDSAPQPVPVRSLVGLIPALAAADLSAEVLAANPSLAAQLAGLLRTDPHVHEAIRFDPDRGDDLLAVCDRDRLVRVLAKMLDPEEFLAPHGVRSLSAYHREHPVSLTLGDHTFTVDYEPAESQTSLFGGNSNWRGPIWFPTNALLVGTLRRYAGWCESSFTIEYPTGSGEQAGLHAVADDLTDRLMSLFLPGPDGQRPCQAGMPWQDDVLFNEYFHGDTGFGLGATHQTGWTALIAALALGWPR